MTQQNLTLKINVSAQDAAAKVQQMTKAFKDLGMTFTNTEVRVNALGKSLTNATTSTQSIAKMKEVGQMTAQIGENFKSLEQSTTKFKELGQAANQTTQQLNHSGQQLLAVNLAANALIGAFRSLIGMWRHALNVNLELNAAQRLLNASTQNGAAAFDWVKHKAYEYGLAVTQLAHDYGIFIASAKDSNMTLKDQNYVFESVTMAVSALGMSTEQSGRIFLALREMLSKNVLTSQELVRQWGNALPGAVTRAAKAFGKGQEEFKKALHTGAIRGNELYKWLVEYARLLREDFEPAAREG